VKIVHTIADVRAHLRPARAAGSSIGLVPTMGAFHEGHLSLIRAARARADVVVVSLFVNPAQFNDPSDLAAYPRDEARDAALAEGLGTDLLFAPPVEEMYPDGFATSVSVGRLGEVLEGAHRPGHFAGVCTAVSKLLNIVQPDVAFFGQKDAQQVVVLRRMVRDLDIPATLEIRPTVREPDGLALSSRNAYLGAEDRARAVALHAGLRAAETAVEAGERDARNIRAAALAALTAFDVEPEYLELVHPDTLEPVARLNGQVLLAVAARVGPARLIDNRLLVE
jgi:pantoate--beta-alanine ligase